MNRTPRVTDPRIERARQAVALVFAVNGIAFASWASRGPAVRDSLDLTSGGFGLLLIAFSVGSLTALPLSGAIVARWGPARTVVGGSLVVTAGLALAAVAIAAGSPWLTAAGLALVGLGISSWDVAMNVEGADVERRLGRSLMPRLHAAFSLGSVVGAGLGAGSAYFDVSVTAQLLVTAAVAFALAAYGTTSFVPVHVKALLTGSGSAGSVLQAWKEPRTLLLGLMVLAFALSEGIANDWLAIAMVDGYDAGEALGAATFGAFVATMTLARLVGGRALERWGRPLVLRTTAVIGAAGVLLVVLGPSAPWAVAGTVLWGLGTSLGFPVGMSAAADDERRAAVRVSVVSSIGYTAFLAGPPLIGFFADEAGILTALVVVPAALALGFVATRAARPLPVGSTSVAPVAVFGGVHRGHVPTPPEVPDVQQRDQHPVAGDPDEH
ncbi:MAG: MFS transporter [Nocardioidaceae bacterium]